MRYDTGSGVTHSQKRAAKEILDPSESTSLSVRKKLLFAMVPILLLYLAGEIVLRIREKRGTWLPPRLVSFSRSNPYMRRAAVPGAHIQIGPMNIGINRWGFRGADFAMPKPANTFRIFAIGESTTFGWPAPTYRDAWPALLEAKLRAAYPARQIEVVNAGLPGATSVEQRINYQLHISRLQPDAILIYHGNNDLNWSWVPQVDTMQLYAHEGSGPPSWWDRLGDHSYVYLWFRTRFFFLHQVHKAKHDEPDPACMRVLKNTLRGWIEGARRMGVKAAIGTFAHALNEEGKPGVYSEDEMTLNVNNLDRWFDYLSVQGVRKSFTLYNNQVRELAASERIPLCDLAPMIPKTPAYHIDWCHFNRRGEEMVAENWFETLKKAGWFQ